MEEMIDKIKLHYQKQCKLLNQKLKNRLLQIQSTVFKAGTDIGKLYFIFSAIG